MTGASYPCGLPFSSLCQAARPQRTACGVEPIRLLHHAQVLVIEGDSYRTPADHEAAQDEPRASGGAMRPSSLAEPARRRRRVRDADFNVLDHEISRAEPDAISR